MRIMKIALVISVAFNLLILGVVVGALFHLRDGQGPRLRGLGPMTPFVVALDDDLRDSVRAELRQGDGDDRTELRTRFASVIDVIRAEPFDSTRLEEVFARQRTAANESQQAGEAVLIQAIAGMGAAERTAYADKLQRWMDKSRRR